MKVKTFPGGIHAGHRKEATRGKKIIEGPVPAEIILPLQQHAGAACEPIVAKGDKVEAGQKVADTDAPVAAPIHSPVFGEVEQIAPRPHVSGIKLLSIIIKPDTEQPGAAPRTMPRDPTPGEIRKSVREAGIVGLGGAAFPTEIKLTPPSGAVIDAVIINGCECEPYLTGDHRLMVEEPERIVDGLKLIMKTVGAARGYIGIETNKPDAVEAMANAAGGVQDVEVVPLEAKYPQGSEKQLIKSILNREVPSRGLPSAVGALVQNVATASAVSRAVREGLPLTTRVMTVSGAGIKLPQNVRALIGTPAKELIETCGGLADGAAKVIMGGPMMGVALTSLEAPVVKSTSGVIALTADEVQEEAIQPCIKCGRCVEACPMGLVTSHLGNLVDFSIWDELADADILDCLECGSCAFVCPSRRPLVQYIKLGKYRLAQDRQRQKG